MTATRCDHGDRCRLGLLHEARAAVAAGLAFDPTFTIQQLGELAPSESPNFLAQRERFYEDLREAGAPE